MNYVRDDRQAFGLSWDGYPEGFPVVPVNALSVAMRRPVCGFGVNDAPYLTQHKIGGKLVHDPAYAAWAAMVKRCASDAYHKHHPTYAGVLVCDEWQSFMAFRAWLVQQHDWQNRALDKDLIAPGCKLYSPATCLMVPGEVNLLFGARRKEQARNAGLPVGVQRNKKGYRAALGINGGREYSTTFKTVAEAAEAYRERKLRYCVEVAARFMNEPQIFAAIIDNAARVYTSDAA